MSKLAEQYTDLDKLRHSCAHVLAQAVKRRYPTAKLGFGPPVEEGFYYDIHLPEALADEDLKEIEAEMERVVKANYSFEKKEVTADEARKIFEAKDETFKLETIDQLEGQEALSVVVDGDFTDLCKYPHAHSTGEIKAFKLTSIAGAYWKGIETNPVMQRIYGTAFYSKKELEEFLRVREEAKKRDHRKIGKQLGLFHVQDEAPGMVFWHPRGWTIWQAIEQYLRDLLSRNGYLEVRTPQLIDRVLWEKSGHWENYKKNMFTLASENRNYAVKPMNCPGHIQIFNQGLKSYRDLPLRMAEFGSCHRNEPSGVLHGIMRVRSFVQDDAHIFCTEAQIGGEALAFIDLLQKVYADFGFTEILVKLSTRPEKRIGSDEVWDRAEKALAQTLDLKGLKYDLQPGEGAFYGPKIEFSLKDCLNRVWQCGTLQLDFSLPERLGAEYVGEDNGRHTPVMLHRAVLGSLERFIGILIEHHAGAFPLWFSPVQISLIPVSAAHEAYAKKISDELMAHGFRIETQAATETLGSRIRTAQNEKIPYMMILGDKEIQADKISVRSRVKGDLGQSSLSEFISKAKEEVAAKVIF